jgi:hypothetical protein
MLGHELAAEFNRVLAHRFRQFVHEALNEDRVLVDVHPAPEARRHMALRMAWSISRFG